jgi:hypothetical protein
MFSDLRNSTCKVPRLRSFFFLIREIYKWEFRALVEWRLTGKTPSNRRKNTSHCYIVQHKSHMDWRGIEPEPPQWEAKQGNGLYSSVKLDKVIISDRTAIKQVNPSASTLWPPTFDLWPRCVAVLLYFEVTPCSLTSGYQVPEGDITSFSKRAALFATLHFN